MNTIVSSALHAELAAACFSTALTGRELVKGKSSIGIAVSAIYRAIPKGDMAAFEAEFGNGLPAKSKQYKAGALQEALVAESQKLAADWLAAEKKKVRIAGEAKKLAFQHLELAAAELAKQSAGQIKQRKTECREAFKLGVVCSETQTVQSALKAAKTKSDTSKGANHGDKKAAKVVIDATATMADIADAVSIWVAKHGGAAEKLAGLLKDTLPIQVIPAAKKTGTK